MTFDRPNRFEFTLGNQHAFEPRTVLTADFLQGQAGVGGYVVFGAEERRTIVDPALPSDLQGQTVIKRLAPRSVLYANQLTMDSEHSALGLAIAGITNEEITGATARNLVWSMFWKLILSDPDSDWADTLDDEWLAATRDEALAAKV